MGAIQRGVIHQCKRQHMGKMAYGGKDIIVLGSAHPENPGTTSFPQFRHHVCCCRAGFRERRQNDIPAMEQPGIGRVNPTQLRSRDGVARNEILKVRGQ